MREIKVNELKEGMTTAVDVFSPKGQLILKRHQAVSAFDIAKFGFYNIASVYVEGSSAQEKEEWNKKYAIIKEKYRDSIDNLHEYMNDILYRNIIPDKNTLIRDSVEIFDRFETSYELFDALQVLKQTDVSTMAHSMNVSIIARLIGVWAGLDTEKLDEISMAGLLHDIGKFTIIAFAAVFIVYNSMEYGNLSIDNISNQNVDVSMADGVSLADEADPLDVYTIHRATEDEARELADGYFSKYGVLIDDSKTDIYDDTIIFYSTSLDDEGSNLSIWCDYEGPTVSFTDFSNIDDENSYADAGLSEEFVREKLENLGVVIPENAVFAPIEEYDAGNYRFTNDGEILDDGLYYKGTIECCINSSGKIANFRDSMIKYTPYKKVDVISEKEAYDRLCAGKFYFPDYDKDEQLSDLVVKSVKISYTPDSKGYYRPVYEFVANANQDTGKREISIMVDAMEI